MRSLIIKTLGALALAGLAGCATMPTTSYVPVMPAPNKPFSVFAQDQQICLAWARQQVAGMAEQTNNNTAASALLGAAIGAGLGAAIGGDGHSAGVGAATGAVAGAAIGNDNAQASGGIQRQFDIAYAQCMYSRGNQVPGMQAPNTAAPPPPPPNSNYSAPPPAYSTPSAPPAPIYPRPPGTPPQ